MLIRLPIRVTAKPRYKEEGVELQDPFDKIEPWVDDEQHFFTMTDLEPAQAGGNSAAWKLGINPKQGWDTPLGIYTYPLDSQLFSQMKSGTLPFVSDRKNILVVRADMSKVLDIANYDASDLRADMIKLGNPDPSKYPSGGGDDNEGPECENCEGSGAISVDCGSCEGDGYEWVECDTCSGKGTVEDEDESGEKAEVSCPDCGGKKGVDATCGECHGSGAESETCDECHGSGKGESDAFTGARGGTPAAKLWNLTRLMADRGHDVKRGAKHHEQAKRSIIDWNVLLRKVLGYEGVVDSAGEGLIHPNEPSQAVFFSTRPLTIAALIENPNSKEKKEKKDQSAYNLLKGGLVEAKRDYILAHAKDFKSPATSLTGKLGEMFKTLPYAMMREIFDTFEGTSAYRALKTNLVDGYYKISSDLARLLSESIPLDDLDMWKFLRKAEGDERRSAIATVFQRIQEQPGMEIESHLANYLVDYLTPVQHLELLKHDIGGLVTNRILEKWKSAFGEDDAKEFYSNIVKKPQGLPDDVVELAERMLEDLKDKYLSMERLEALPEGSVVVSEQTGQVWNKVGPDKWNVEGSTAKPIDSVRLSTMSAILAPKKDPFYEEPSPWKALSVDQLKEMPAGTQIQSTHFPHETFTKTKFNDWESPAGNQFAFDLVSGDIKVVFQPKAEGSNDSMLPVGGKTKMNEAELDALPNGAQVAFNTTGGEANTFTKKPDGWYSNFSDYPFSSQKMSKFHAKLISAVPEGSGSSTNEEPGVPPEYKKMSEDELVTLPFGTQVKFYVAPTNQPVYTRTEDGWSLPSGYSNPSSYMEKFPGKIVKTASVRLAPLRVTATDNRLILRREGHQVYAGTLNGKRVVVRKEEIVAHGSFPANRRQKREHIWTVTVGGEKIGEVGSLKEARGLAMQACVPPPARVTAANVDVVDSVGKKRVVRITAVQPGDRVRFKSEFTSDEKQHVAAGELAEVQEVQQETLRVFVKTTDAHKKIINVEKQSIVVPTDAVELVVGSEDTRVASVRVTAAQRQPA